MAEPLTRQRLGSLLFLVLAAPLAEPLALVVLVLLLLTLALGIPILLPLLPRLVLLTWLVLTGIRTLLILIAHDRSPCTASP
ncbi:hypothetical protein [Stenotrophomonas rhizophila]|uniref:hypothetical protein n=1 Tax=Stenotrophomonas rhizophila TaxID=216778 RepID=UPI0016038497|nr:hypothetical protein [Stenotrophomonas rhizophila]